MKVGVEKRGRNGVIDAYRGIAVMAVMAFHYFSRWAAPFNFWFYSDARGNLYGFNHIYSPLFQLGQFGVHLFFVISGLVITMTVLRCKTALEFAVRRFARLFPALFVCSLLSLTFVNAFGPANLHRTAIDWLTSLTFDPVILHHEAVDGVYWSLLVEVKFYIWVALLFQFLGKRFWIGLVALSVLEIPLQAVSPKLAGYLVPNYLPFFLLGVSAWQLLFERDRKAGTIVGIVGALLFAVQLPGYTVRLTYPYLHPIAEVALTAAIAIMLLTIRLPAPGWLAPLSAIGRWSYGLYLLHQHIGVSIIRIATGAGAPDLVAVALASGILIGLAWLIHIWVELPGQAAIMKRYRALAAARPAT